MASLRSPFIVSFYGISHDKVNGAYSLVMEYLPGRFNVCLFFFFFFVTYVYLGCIWVCHGKVQRRLLARYEVSAGKVQSRSLLSIITCLAFATNTHASFFPS
jgi:hypothetical protein